MPSSGGGGASAERRFAFGQRSGLRRHARHQPMEFMVFQLVPIRTRASQPVAVRGYSQR